MPPQPQTLGRFEQTVLVYLDAAYNLARWLTRSDHDAQDVVQDASLRALRAFDHFRGGDARAWFLAIVRNVAFDFLHARKPASEFDEVLHELATEEVDPPSILSRADDAGRVRAAIETLPIEIRTTIVLREMEQLSYKEIAAITVSPIGTVMSRLSRGRERLASLLGDRAEVGDMP
jgi:RNA polymerase sigma-70 factor (ECF subfamily)